MPIMAFVLYSGRFFNSLEGFQKAQVPAKTPPVSLLRFFYVILLLRISLSLLETPPSDCRGYTNGVTSTMGSSAKPLLRLGWLLKSACNYKVRLFCLQCAELKRHVSACYTTAVNGLTVKLETPWHLNVRDLFYLVFTIGNPCVCFWPVPCQPTSSLFAILASDNKSGGG